MRIYDVVIIGSGPAGYTAGLYLARAKLSPVVLAGEKHGGQLMLTTEVENYPGFQRGILGPELMASMREQAKRFGAEIFDVTASGVDFSKQPFRIWTDQGNERKEYLGKAVIIATGARARLLGVGEERLLGRGVSTCAVCDAAFFKDKVTFVVGGGDAAMEEVLSLARYARSVTLIHRRDTLRASKIMQERVLEGHKDRVKSRWNSQVVGVTGEKKLEAITVEDTKTGKKEELATDGLFISIGHVPETSIFDGQVELDQKGYLVTKLTSSWSDIPQKTWLEDYPTMTSVQGVFGAGDVVDFRYRQAVTAAGMGCMAALDVEKYLTGSMQSW